MTACCHKCRPEPYGFNITCVEESILAVIPRLAQKDSWSHCEVVTTSLRGEPHEAIDYGTDHRRG